MPVTPTYPGVYIEEIPSGVRTIVSVATSITAFIGRALRGPVNEAVRIQSFADFERSFGGLWAHSTMSYAVQHYFLNGGRDAIIVRVVRTEDADASNNASKATLTLGGLDLEAASEGDWGNNLRATIDHNTADPSDNKLFNLTIDELAAPSSTEVVGSETFRNTTTDPDAKRFVTKVIEQESYLVNVGANVPEFQPVVGTDVFTGGNDGDAPTFEEYEGSQDQKNGIYALEKTDLFNILCIPPFTRNEDVATTTWDKALKYCKERRAILLVDPLHAWGSTSDVESGVDGLSLRDENAAIFFPYVKMADPLKENRLEEFAPCGAVAGIFARTDAQRGVWKAPAGIEATLRGVRELSYKLTDGENGQLNPLGVNCLRTFPVIGHIVWGARTLEGADKLASEWKYIPVRRLALYIEESLYRGTQWVVFEPNDEPLWAQIRLNVGAFMQNLFRQGAFQGKTPREAYFVKCDKETTTQNDINLGIVNILVGFAPLKPAEFVIIKIQQIAGQIET
jgi:phage tail sheath protein FI